MKRCLNSARIPQESGADNAQRPTPTARRDSRKIQAHFQMERLSSRRDFPFDTCQANREARGEIQSIKRPGKAGFIQSSRHCVALLREDLRVASFSLLAILTTLGTLYNRLPLARLLCAPSFPGNRFDGSSAGIHEFLIETRRGRGQCNRLKVKAINSHEVHIICQWENGAKRVFLDAVRQRWRPASRILHSSWLQAE